MAGIARMSLDSEEVLHDEHADIMSSAPLSKPQTAAHGIKVNTVSNFYKSHQIEDLSQRPGSGGNFAPRARIVSHYTHHQQYRQTNSLKGLSKSRSSDESII